MEEATTATLKSKLDESREFKVDARLVMEECIELRDKEQPLEVDLEVDILELLVNFLHFRKNIRDEFPAAQVLDNTMNTPARRPKKKCIQQMEYEWVDATFNGKFTPKLAKLMMAGYHLNCMSLQEVLAEWIVENITDVYPDEINEFLGIECDHSEEFLQKHREEYDWAYVNVENSLKQRNRRKQKNIEEDEHDNNNNGDGVTQAQETTELEERHRQTQNNIEKDEHDNDNNGDGVTQAQETLELEERHGQTQMNIEKDEHDNDNSGDGVTQAQETFELEEKHRPQTQKDIEKDEPDNNDKGDGVTQALEITELEERHRQTQDNIEKDEPDNNNKGDGVTQALETTELEERHRQTQDTIEKDEQDNNNKGDGVTQAPEIINQS